MKKKLLILGATTGEVSLVRRAQQMGFYVIATDNHLDYDLAPAKKAADEAWDVSWSDIDQLEKMCRSSGVDGVIAGYSEFRVENMIKLCERLGLPSYINMEQLDITRDKVKFKECCRKYGVPTVKEYSSVEAVDHYPVIVKPTDRAGSIGISIASNQEELDAAYRYALESSVEKKVIIEDYLYDNVDKVDFYYWIEDGVITLLTSCDTVNAKDNGFSRVVQTAWLYPERHIASYDAKVRNQIENMIRGMGIQNGCIFFSGFVDENKDFVFFECGFRLEGAHQYYYTERRGPVNFLDTFILHALYGSSRDAKRKPVNDRLKCVTINVFAKAGTIGAIRGCDEIAAMADCTLALVHGRVGQVCKDDRAILSKIVVMAFANESASKLKEDVDEAYGKLQILDADGNDLIYDRLDTAVIETWWA